MAAVSMYALIPAAGDSVRMGGHVSAGSKLFLDVTNGVSVLEHTIRSIVRADICCGIVVSSRADALDRVDELLARVAPDHHRIIVTGGNTRQASVYRALQSVGDHATHVLIHDGARPLCPSERVRAVAEEGVKTGAAILGLPVESTLKAIDSHGETVETVPRERYILAQTPQVFRTELIMRAHERAMVDQFIGTDDSALVERLGVQSKVVLGSSLNIKITSPDEVTLMRALLQPAA